MAATRAQMTRLFAGIRLVISLHEPYQALPSASMGNGTVNLAREYR